MALQIESNSFFSVKMGVELRYTTIQGNLLRTSKFLVRVGRLTLEEWLEYQGPRRRAVLLAEVVCLRRGLSARLNFWVAKPMCRHENVDCKVEAFAFLCRRLRGCDTNSLQHANGLHGGSSARKWKLCSGYKKGNLAY